MEFVRGSHRELIPLDVAAELRRAGALLEDRRRQRPRWFDGRFLSARDLTREQQYFLTREADLGRAVGSGVVAGLGVEAGEGGQTLSIASGHGITPSGELVLVERPLSVDLGDLPRTENLSGKFGLGRIPVPPLRSRTGLFAIALRPVEFTDNPVGAYPTSITGERTVEDGDIIEATAIVLVPWPQDASGPLDARRAQAARSIFVEGSDRGLPADVLPLAMVALADNVLAWIDVPMLRRELGADRGDLPGLGLAPRALRLAHLLQHERHVADVVASTGGRPFAAASVFPALPPAGPLPPGVIDPSDFTQRYFPAEIAVDFAVIPEDELPALVEESLALPGIDLTADPETMTSSAVMVLAPVPRAEWRAVLARLEKTKRSVRPAAPNRVAARKPLEILQKLRVPAVPARPLDPTSPSDSEWQRLARLDSLWFVRRRNVAYREDVAGTAMRLAGHDVVLGDSRLARLEALGLRELLDTTLERATPSARTEITTLLASGRVAESPALTAAALGEFARAEKVDMATALKTSSVVTAPAAGAGLARLDAAGIGENAAAIERISSDPEWRLLDREARVASSDGILSIAERLGGSVRDPAGGG